MSEVQNTTKEWKSVSQHNSYESADKKRKFLLEQNKDNEDFLVKVKRLRTGDNNYVVKTYTKEEEIKESKYAKKKREKAKRRQQRLKQDG
jgi:hypothetical protein